jgi:hypothetical protein
MSNTTELPRLLDLGKGKLLDGKKLLHEVEERIQKGMQVFYKVGKELRYIRDTELYKFDGFGSWEQYCRERWEWSPEHCRRLMVAAEYRERLPSPPIGGDNGDNKSGQWTEASVRELTRMPDRRDAERVAKKVLAKVENEGCKLTASLVRKEVDKDLGVKRGKPEPKPEDPEGNLHTYIDQYTSSIEVYYEILEPVDQDACKILERTRFGLLERFNKACERLAELSRKLLESAK